MCHLCIRIGNYSILNFVCAEPLNAPVYIASFYHHFMKKNIFLLLLGLFFTQNSFAQIANIFDEASGLPLVGVTLSSASPQVQTATNAQGEALLSDFKNAPAITIAYVGYETITLSYTELETRRFTVLLRPAQLTLDQVVVSAARWSQSRREVPGRVNRLSAKTLALQNPQNAADLLGASGEVFIQKSQQGGGSPMIRGFSTNRLLYAVDGVRMNTAIFRSGNIQNVISLDPFAIENAEIFFGPGTVMYGSDAIGGVMSFSTLSAKLADDGESRRVNGRAIARYSSANQERTAHFDVNVGGKKWALLSSFSHFNFGDLRQGRFGPSEYLRPYYLQRIDGKDVVVSNPDPLVQRPTGYEQTNLMQKVRFQPNNAWNFEYAFHYSTTTDYPRYDRLQRLRNGAPRSAEWTYGPQVWAMHQLSATHKSYNKLYDEATLRLAAQRFEESRHDRDLNKTTRFNRYEEVDAWSANLDFYKTLGQRSKLYYGLEYVLDQVTSRGTNEDVATQSIAEGASRYPDADWTTYAAYLNYQLRLSQTLLLQTGARYSSLGLAADFSDNLPFFPFPFREANLNSGAVSGSLGLVYTPDERWIISLNGSTGFRAPNVDDLGKVFDSSPGAVVVPNPDLKPEYAYNGELGIAHVFGKAVKLDVSAYYTRLDNALVRRNFTLNGQDSILYNGELSQVQAVQNAAFAYVYGVQAGLEVKIPGGWTFLSQFNAQKGEEELDNGEKRHLRHAAPWFGLSRLSYTRQGLTLQWDVQYMGTARNAFLSDESLASDYIFAKDAEGKPYSPGWYTLNFRSTYQLNKTWLISGGVENITDQRYRPYTSGVSAPGRNFVLALTMSW